jgi:hypothetical protein
MKPAHVVAVTTAAHVRWHFVSDKETRAGERR